MRYTLEFQLNVDRSAGNPAEIAFCWLDEMSQALAADARAEIADQPAKVSRGDGLPNAVFGIVTLTRWGQSGKQLTAERNASVAGMEWLRRELADVPWRTGLWLGRFDENGHRSGWLANLRVQRMEESPDWLRLSAYVPELMFLDPVDGSMLQRRYLDAVLMRADLWNPGFGHLSYVVNDGATAFEACLRRIDNPIPQEWWDHRYTVNYCREFLRGYSWLTIVPEELAARLGGPAALAATGAFTEVRSLKNGGIWLLATSDYGDFNDDALRGVFNAVAPVLRPGPLTNWPRYGDQSPLRVVFEDASTITRTQRRDS